METDTGIFFFIVFLALTWIIVWQLAKEHDKKACVCPPTAAAAAAAPAPAQTPQSPPPQTIATPSTVIERDYRVMSDPLYPPVNRLNTETTVRFMNEPRLHPMNNYAARDTYRVVGYLVNQEDNKDVWKLYAKERYARGSLADFYAEAANRNFDIKIELTDDIVASTDSGAKFRDLYNLPSVVTIKHPMFSMSPYNVVEYKQANLGSGYY